MKQHHNCLFYIHIFFLKIWCAAGVNLAGSRNKNGNSVVDPFMLSAQLSEDADKLEREAENFGIQQKVLHLLIYSGCRCIILFVSQETKYCQLYKQ